MRRISHHQIIFGVEYVDWEGLGTVRIKWNKGVDERMSFKSYEMAYCSSIEHEHEIDLLWNGMRQAENLENPMRQQGNKKLNEKRIHPTQKPKQLYKWILKNFAKEGNKILDTHLGSGSIVIAIDDVNKFEKMNLTLTGSEIDKEYFEAMMKRVNNEISQSQLF